MKIVNNLKDQSRTIVGPAVAVDAVLFAIQQEELKVLLIKISEDVYKDRWALPGGLVKIDESLDEAAKRILFQKTNVEGIHLEQLYTFGDPKRDLRGRSVSVAYFALVNDINKFRPKTTSYYSEIAWWPIQSLPVMAYDHEKIIKEADQRLKAKINYTNIVYSLLPGEFSLTELQKTYEIILGEKIDKRNFRKKIFSLGLVKEVGQKRLGEPNRPAELYKFCQKKLVYY